MSCENHQIGSRLPAVIGADAGPCRARATPRVGMSELLHTRPMVSVAATDDETSRSKRGSLQSVSTTCSTSTAVDLPMHECDDAAEVARESTHRLAGDRRARVAFVTNGSFGDIRPFVEVALKLRQNGYEVAMMTNANLIDYCTAHGLHGVASFADNQELFLKVGGLGGRSLFDQSKEFLQHAAKWKEEHACRSWWSALDEFSPDVLICGSNCWGHGIEYELATQVPAVFAFMNRQSLTAFENVTVRLEPARPILLAVSEFLDRDPLPQVPHVHRTPEWAPFGEPLLACSSCQALVDQSSITALTAFLKRCEAMSQRPAVVGWGSMIPRSVSRTALLGLALRALKRCNQPGVIIGGWAELDRLGKDLIDGKLVGDPDLLKDHEALRKYARENVCFVSTAPHEWLFRQAACIVHHGGNGTTHAALRSGRGQVVVPVFGDQFDNANAVTRLQVGVAVDRVPIAEIRPAELAGALLVAQSEPIRKEAQAVSRHIRKEDGAEAAANIIRDFIEKDVNSGAWLESWQHAHKSSRLVSR